MTQQLKHLIVGQEHAGSTVVFSGGACNAITAEGEQVRNTRRDGLNAWLDAQEILFFDPQIHESTHGRGYTYKQDGPAEQAARKAAKVTLYEVGDDTLAGVTCLEVLRDVSTGKRVVLWITGSRDGKGKPVFKPAGDLSAASGAAAVHLQQYVKAGTQLRQNLLDFVEGAANLVVVYSEEDAKETIRKLLQD